MYYHKEFWLFALSASVILTLIYFIGLQLALLIWPKLPELWNWHNLSGISILKIPIEEIIWIILYGPAWSLSMVFFMDAKILRSKKQIAQET
jgi:hypothetical protein